MSAGDSAGEVARAAAEKANLLRAQAQRLEQVAEAYERGERGEQYLERLAEPLAAHGYHLLADRCVPGKESNIDFLLVGPAGVFVVDAKNWSGDLEVDGSVLRQNGRRREEETERVRSQAEVVSGVLVQAGAAEGAVPVHSVLAFVGEAGVGGAAVCDGVHVVDGAELVEFVGSFDPALRGEHVAWADKALDHGLAPRTANREHAGDPGTASPPPEPIVFLTPWRKYGKSRIYVKDEEGVDGGHLDLVSGEVSSESSTAASVLTWLLPHYLDGDGDLDEAELGVIRRFLKKKSRKKRRSAEPIVVGYRWQNHGRSRLYVSRIDAEGTKVDLGWYDLKEQRVHEEAAGLAPIVRYCGERYESVDSRR